MSATGRLVAERQFGPYRLVRQIAVGGMAEIHLAKTKGIAGFEKYVALKMIHPNFAEDEQFIQMLVDEAKIAVQLTHANIAQTFDLGRVGDTYYITMEYVDGSDLYKVLRRASEIEVEMPLDVCAFIAKDMLTALDHAHRKRDHTGKSLQIVHRDVSPQNVLVSFAGEVKLVDFGIAKATSKAKQTAAGVIKGKYYYMSPEQSWGDPLDHRSDIFSAGIVLYEMMTGQMLYLEEDLHRLLEMVRKADIASPTTLRKGIPPQLERIVMHALSKVPGERYQSAGDMATDLERFLHAYSPVFTASKVANLIRSIVGDPQGVEQEPDIEVRDGPLSTHELNTEDLAHSVDEIRDENSMIFNVEELKAQHLAKQAPKAPTRAPTAATPPKPSPVVAKRPALAKPRDPDEQTREVSSAPAGDEGDSGLLTVAPGLRGKKHPALMPEWDATETHPGDDDLENIGEHTMITAPNFAGLQVSDDDDLNAGGEATMITAMPHGPDLDEGDDDPPEDDGPTMQRDFSAKPVGKPRAPATGRKGPPPAALAAKIQTPSVSALRTPKPSRRTPPGGVPAQSALQAIVNSQPSDAMPSPPMMAPRPPPYQPPPSPQPQQQYPIPAFAQGYAQTNTPANGQPYVQPQPQPPQQPYMYPPPQPMQPQAYYPPQQYPQMQMPMAAQMVQPHALYGMQPRPMPATLTGQLRLSEIDELPQSYKLDGKRRWFMLVVGGIVAISLAAGVTFFIIRATKDSTPMVASVKIESSPSGADVYYDDTRLSDRTPMAIENVPTGTRHDIKVTLSHYKTYTDTIDIPKSGEQVPVMALLKKLTGKIVINSKPDGAEILINGELRGRTPKTIEDVDMDSAKTLDVRLKDHQPITRTLEWPANGQIDLDLKFDK